VGEVVDYLENGFSCSKHNTQGEGIPHLRPMNVSSDGEVSFDYTLYVPPDAGTLRLIDEDVLFTNTSSTIWVGKSALIQKPGDWAFSNHMTRLKASDGVVPEFIAQQLHYLCISGYFAFHCTKHINQSSVSSTQLAAVPFRLAPTTEQIRIVTKLGNLLRRERSIRKALESLLGVIEDCRTSILSSACRGTLVSTEASLSRRKKREYETASDLLKSVLTARRRKWNEEQLAKFVAGGKKPSNDDWMRRYKEPIPPARMAGLPLPRGWALVSMDHCGLVQLGRMRSPKNRSKNFPRPYVRAANITEKGLNLHDLMTMDFPPSEFERYRLREGDILIAEASGSPLQVGKPAIWRGEVPDCCFQNTVIRLRPTLVSSEFLLIVLQYLYRSGAFAESSSGSGINHLSAERFLRMPVALPPTREQRRIAADVRRRMKTLDQLDAALRVALSEIAELRESLYYRAFSGQLVSQRVASESATSLLGKIEGGRAARTEERRREKRDRPRRKKVKEITKVKALSEISITHLSEILRDQNRPLSARALWKESDLTIDDFYGQLKREMNVSVCETKDRMLEVKQ
jgi:type I restriction enzyme, S subunit